MKTKNLRIIICSGGTGGHLFPSKAVAENLLKTTYYENINNVLKYQIDFFTDKRSLVFLEELNEGITIKTILTLPFSGKNVFLKVKSLLFISLGCIQSIMSFLFKRPKIVVAFGGYVTVPILFAAVVLRIPIILHEQNAVLGKTNRLFVKYAKVIATSFELTLGLNKFVTKVQYTGLPIREEIINATNVVKKTEYLTISVLGGSQGSKIFGTFIPKAFSLLPLKTKQQLLIYHQCRRELLNDVINVWKTINVKSIVKPFFKEIASILHNSDLIISRSGASTIAEINYCGKPAVYIPFKQAILNHQVENALAMEKIGAAAVILEENLSFQKFNDIIKNILDSKSTRNKMALSAKQASKPNAVKLLTAIIMKLAVNKYATF